MDIDEKVEKVGIRRLTSFFYVLLAVPRVATRWIYGDCWWLSHRGSTKSSNPKYPRGRATKNDGKSPILMGKSTISIAIFNSKLLVYQRLDHFSIETHGDLVPHCTHVFGSIETRPCWLEGQTTRNRVATHNVVPLPVMWVCFFQPHSLARHIYIYRYLS